MFTKIVLATLAIIAIGAGIFMYHLGMSGGIPKPSWGVTGSSSLFSFLPSFKPSVSLPSLGGNGGSGSSGGAQGQTPTYLNASGEKSATGLLVDTSTIPASQIPKGFTANQLSPYFHEVQFGGVSYGGRGYYGTITLNTVFANPKATGTIDITGWHIKTRASGEYIPQAIAVYEPSGLSKPSDIRLRNGDVVYLYSSSAPFNLRLNECIGYVANMANFTPALPRLCPAPSSTAGQQFTDSCQEYIQTLSGCAQPNLSNPLVPRTDYACQNYLETHFNYTSCFNAHKSDPHFLSNQVWVWMGANVVGRYHDTVDLFDSHGLLVAQYSY